MRNSAKALGLAAGGILALEGIFAAPGHAECVAKAPPRPVHRTYIRRDVVEPGVYEVGRRAALYGWICRPGEEPRRVLLRPYKNVTHFQRPYVAWSREHVTVVPEVPAIEPDC